MFETGPSVQCHTINGKLLLSQAKKLNKVLLVFFASKISLDEVYFASHFAVRKRDPRGSRIVEVRANDAEVIAHHF